MQAGESPGQSGGEAWLSPRLDAALTGRLPCVVCGYELQGLSIRGVCPECGSAVRATILYQVDPEADEFKPMIAPRITAVSLAVCAFSAVVLTIAAWAPRLADLVALLGVPRPGTALFPRIGLGAAAFAGISLLGVARPTRETPWWRTVGVLIAVVAFGPLGWAMWQIQSEIDPFYPAPYIDRAWNPGGVRTLCRLVFGASAITVLVGFRPVARELVRRSLALRTGRVDRQTILAMVGALVVAACGDLVHLAAADQQMALLAGAGTMLIALGSGFLTLGVVGAAIDSWRVRRAILTPAPSLRQVIGSAAGVT